MSVRLGRRGKLIAGSAAIALAAGGGAAFAATKIGSAHFHPTPAAPGTFGAAGGGGFSGSASPGDRGVGDDGLGRDFGGGRLGDLGAAAAYLHISTSALQSELQGGKTLAQIAKAHGKSAGGLVDALVAAQKSQLDAAVKAGRLTTAQARQIESLLKQRASALVNGTGRGFGEGDGRGFRGGGGDFGGGGGGFGGGSGGFGGGSGSFGGSAIA